MMLPSGKLVPGVAPQHSGSGYPSRNSQNEAGPSLTPYPAAIRTPALPLLEMLVGSPFGYHSRYKVDLLNELASKFSVVRFNRGDELPDSPFYFIARGDVRVARVADGRPICRKSPGSFINWSAEYRGETNKSALLLRRLYRACMRQGARRDSDEPIDSSAMSVLGASSDGLAHIMTQKVRERRERANIYIERGRRPAAN